MSAVLGSGGHLASYALELMERRLVSGKRDLGRYVQLRNTRAGYEFKWATYLHTLELLRNHMTTASSPCI
jgi:hypothetical protein